MNVAVQHDGKTPTWWKAIGQSVGLRYAPFGIMAIYTLRFVACPHCKKTVWEILPLAPGLTLKSAFEPRMKHRLNTESLG